MDKLNIVKKKALIIVDVQPAFIKENSDFVAPAIVDLIKTVPYDLYIESLFHAEKDSIWNKQTDWVCPKDDTFYTVPEIIEVLKDKNCIKVEKETKSVFKGNPNILSILKENGIEEIHIVGCDIDCCVLATAYESFDFGFFTYVIEECTASSSKHKEIRDNTMSVLRRARILKKIDEIKNHLV